MIERKLMAHYVNASTPDEQASYCRIGQDLEEYSASMSAQVDSKKNILGETSVKVSSYEKTGSVEPYYADENDPMFARLQNIIDNELVLDDLKTDVVDVHLWKTATSGAYEAVKFPAVIEVTSYGGDTTGYQIPYTLHYTGMGIKGTFDVASKTFTETK